MGFGPRFEAEHTVGSESFTVIMRGYSEGDAMVLAGMLDDYRMQQFVHLSGSPTVKDEEEWLERVRTSKDQTIWMICVRQQDEETLVGSTSLAWSGSQRLCSGILLSNTAWWGKGIASLTHRFRTWYAFRELGAYAIDSGYVADNVASGRALRSVGYIDYGRLWRSNFTAGKWRDEILVVCYNPLTASVLWPDGKIQAKVQRGMQKTQVVLDEVQNIVKPR